MRATGCVCRLLWVALMCACVACHDPNAYIISPNNANLAREARQDLHSGRRRLDRHRHRDHCQRGGVRQARSDVHHHRRHAHFRQAGFNRGQGHRRCGRRGDRDPSRRHGGSHDSGRRKVQSVVRSATIEFTAPVADNTFTLTSDQTSIPADGFSTATLTVNLVAAGPAATRAVEFQTSAGTLLAPGITSGTKISVSATANGLAIAQLESSKNAGTAHVTVTAMNVTRTLDVVFGPVEPTSVIRLVASDSVLPADGKSTARLTATIAAGLPDSKRTVRFRTTAGRFLPENGQDVTRPADSSQQARVDLQVDALTGFARVSAEVDGTVSNDVGISFAPALPTRLTLSSVKGRLASGEDTSLTVTLLRDVGTVSPNTVVSYSAVDKNGDHPGVFEDIKASDANGISTANFSLGATTYTGPITITASVANGPSASITLVVN